MKFYKVSFGQYKKDYIKYFYGENKDYPSDLDNYLSDVYNSILIPTRSTSGSSGYDFKIPFTTKLESGDFIMIPTGIRVELDDNKLLTMYPRSSMGVKGLYILNTTPIIDSDYFYAKNEGHIMVFIGNRSEEDINISSGEKFVQGIIIQFFTTDDDNCTDVRSGGFGSTGR